MQNFNLPPGCTDFDIDRAAGVTSCCSHCRREVYTDDLVEEGDEFMCKRCAKSYWLADNDYRDDDVERENREYYKACQDI